MFFSTWIEHLAAYVKVYFVYLRCADVADRPSQPVDENSARAADARKTRCPRRQQLKRSLIYIFMTTVDVVYLSLSLSLSVCVWPWKCSKDDTVKTLWQKFFAKVGRRNMTHAVHRRLEHRYQPVDVFVIELRAVADPFVNPLKTIWRFITVTALRIQYIELWQGRDYDWEFKGAVFEHLTQYD